MRYAMILALLGWSLAACSTNPVERERDPAPTAARAAIGDTFRLSPGDIAEVGTDGLLVRFDGVSADSRCPLGVDCVWAGDAAARFGLAFRQASWTPAELHTHEEPKQVRHENHTVALLDLEPYPREGSPTRADDYVAVIRVTTP